MELGRLADTMHGMHQGLLRADVCALVHYSATVPGDAVYAYSIHAFDCTALDLAVGRNDELRAMGATRVVRAVLAQLACLEGTFLHLAHHRTVEIVHGHVVLFRAEIRSAPVASTAARLDVADLQARLASRFPWGYACIVVGSLAVSLLLPQIVTLPWLIVCVALYGREQVVLAAHIREPAWDWAAGLVILVWLLQVFAVYQEEHPAACLALSLAIVLGKMTLIKWTSIT
jgi:hypothetical protein